MSEEDWNAAFARSLGVFLNGGAIPTPNERGEQIMDDSFYVMFNTSHEPVTFTLPERQWGERWTTVLNTHDEADHLGEEEISRPHGAGAKVRTRPWSLVLLRRIQ
jgi:glycogen operon protein